MGYRGRLRGGPNGASLACMRERRCGLNVGHASSSLSWSARSRQAEVVREWQAVARE